MALIHLPQDKWGSGTGRQVILKSDFDKIERAVVESFEFTQAPGPDYVDDGKIRVKATDDCKARVMLCGFPSPLHQGQWVKAGLTDGRYRENASPVTLDFVVSGSLWGSEKPDQWYCVYAVAGSTDTTFQLKAMPVMRASSQDSQTVSLRNNANTATIGYGFTANELADAKLLVLSGDSRGLVRLIAANNDDNSSGGTITYSGSALNLAQGDWLMVLPNTNFRYLGMVLNDAAGNLVPFYQDGPHITYQSGRALSAGAINGYTLIDLGLVTPPTARLLEGYAAATEGYDLKLAISYDGGNPALILHGTPPEIGFQGLRGAMPFRCRVLAGNQLFLNNENTAHQAVNVTGWRE
jgi:hypothetical protein